MPSLALTFDIIAKDNASKALKDVGDAADKTSGRMGAFGKVAAGVAAGGLAVLGAGLVSTFKGGIEELQVNQKAMAQFRAGLESTGGVAGVSAGQMQKLADSIEAKTGTDGAAVVSGGALLATFTKVRNEMGKGNDVFNRATQAGVDLAARGFGSVEGNAVLLGKALNDPIQGLTALGKQGVTFTAEQKKTIQALVATGDTLGAQKIILKEIEGQVGGSAAAYGQTLPGQLDRARAALDSVKETVVKAVLPAFTGLVDFVVNRLIPGMQSFAERIGPAVEAVGAVFRDRIVPAVQDAAAKIKDFLGAIPLPVLAGIGTALGVMAASALAMAAASGIATIATTAYAAAQRLLNTALFANPIGLVVLGLTALVGGLTFAYKNSETFRDKVDAAFRVVKEAGAGLARFVTETVPKAFNDVKDKVSDAATRMKNAVGDAWFAIKGAIPAAWEAIKGAVTTAVGTVVAYIAGRPAQFVENVQLIWSAIRNAVSGAWNLIRDSLATAFGVLVEYIKGRPQQFVDNMQLIWTAIKNAVPGAFNAIRDKIGDAFTGAGGILAKVKGFGKDIPEAIVDGIKSAGSIVLDAAKAQLNKLPGVSFKIGGNAGDGPGAPPPGGRGGKTLSRVQGIVASMGGAISSTYRSPARNRAVGGSPTSYHMDASNPAVDIVGSTAVLDAIHARLRAIGGWRELLWRVPNHAPGDNPHIHVAHAGGTVDASWATLPGLRRDERPVITQVGEVISTRSDMGDVVSELRALRADTRDHIRYTRDLAQQLESLDRRTKVGG